MFIYDRCDVWWAELEIEIEYLKIECIIIRTFKLYKVSGIYT